MNMVTSKKSRDSLLQFRTKLFKHSSATLLHFISMQDPRIASVVSGRLEANCLMSFQEKHTHAVCGLYGNLSITCPSKATFKVNNLKRSLTNQIPRVLTGFHSLLRPPNNKPIHFCPLKQTQTVPIHKQYISNKLHVFRKVTTYIRTHCIYLFVSVYSALAVSVFTAHSVQAVKDELQNIALIQSSNAWARECLREEYDDFRRTYKAKYVILHRF